MLKIILKVEHVAAVRTVGLKVVEGHMIVEEACILKRQIEKIV
jgi:hypothetical protein